MELYSLMRCPLISMQVSLSIQLHCHSANKHLTSEILE